MIYIHRWNSLNPDDRETLEQPFQEGLRVRDVLPDSGLRLLRNGSACQPDDELEDFDHVAAIPELGDPVTFTINLIITAAISYAVQLLIPSPDPPVGRENSRSANRGFSAMSNTRTEGQPIEVLYGEHRVAGTIISEFVRVNNETLTSTYYALVSLGHGPIDSIAGITQNTPDGSPLTNANGTLPAGIQIEGNPSVNYSGIKAWVRLGTDDQKSAPGFERAYRTAELGALLEQRQVGAATKVIPEADYLLATYDDIWDEWAFGWDTIRRDCDEVDVILNFPRGLYRVDSTSSDIKVASVVIQIRFCRLDNEGNPLLGPGRGGAQDDGWVRLPQKTITKSEQSPFQISVPVALYDPQDYQAADPGGALHIDTWTAGSYLRTVNTLDSTRRPEDWAPSPVGHNFINRFGFEGWFAFDASTTDGPFGSWSGDDQYLCLMEWASSSPPTGNGLWVGFRLTPDGGWFPMVRYGYLGINVEWPDVRNLIEKTTDANDKRWHHIVFSYRFESGNNCTQTIFINGVSVGSINTLEDLFSGSVGLVAGFAIQLAGTAGLLCPNSGGHGINPGSDSRLKLGHGNLIINSDYALGAWVDEFVLWNKALTAADVAARYQQGRGQRVDQDDFTVVGVWRFNGDLTDDTGTNDFEEIGSSGLISTGTTDGVVGLVVAPEAKRAKYRIQALRVNGREPDSATATAERRQDDVEWDLAVTSIEESFDYPRIAHLALEVPATGQLNSNAPNITAVAKGRTVPVWDGESTISPTAPESWSANPAWIMADMAINAEYGAGSVFSLSQLDLVGLKAIADACDKRVYDRKGQRYFYRQEFENTNFIATPERFVFWPGDADVTSNTALAPDGNYTADLITDADSSVTGPAASESITTTISGGAPKEQAYYCYSCFFKKQPDADFSSSLEVIIRGSTHSCSFNTSDGTAVSGCTVEDYSVDWWLVKMDPFEEIGASASGGLQARIFPARYQLGTTIEDGTLTGSVTAWGAFLHRGRTHLDYFTESKPRCYLYMADLDDSGVEQTIPEHWQPGKELQLSGCADSNWDTPAGVTKALEIKEVQTRDDIDGYDRVWILTCEWYSEDTDTHPDSSFPNLATDARDWTDISGNWLEQSGDTLVAEFDDGGTTGGPTHPEPLQSTVLKHSTDHGLGTTKQTVTNAPGDTLKFRAKAYRPAGVDSLILNLRDGSEVGSDNANDAADADEWVVLTAEVLTSTASPKMELAYIDASANSDFYVGSIGIWVSSETLTGYSPGGTVEGAEELYRYDGVFDTFSGFWDTLIEVGRSCRTVPVRAGNRLSFKQEVARNPVGLISMGSILREAGGESSMRVSYTGGLIRPNYISLDIQDRDANYDRRSVEVQASSLADLSDPEDIVQESVSLPGVTRASQAERHAEYMLRVYDKSNVEGSLRTSPGSIAWEPGSLVSFGHDILPLGSGGRASRGATTGLNLIAADNEDFTAWTVPSGYVTVTPNVVAGPTGIPNADLVAVDDALQGPVELIGPELSDGSVYMFSIRVKKKVGTKIGFSLSQDYSGTTTIVHEYTWATKTLTQVTSVSGVTAGVIEEAKGWIRFYCEYEAKATDELKMIVVPERNAPSYDGARVYLADAMLEAETASGLPSTYDRPGDGIWLDRDITLEAAVSYTARITNKTTGKSETCSVTAGAGQFLEGDLMAVDTSALTFTIEQGDEYLIYSEAERFEGVITSLGVNSDSSVDVEFVRYDSSVFDGDE